MSSLEEKAYQLQSYGSHERQKIIFFDSIQPFSTEFTLPVLVFIHGGAWRDPNNTLHDVDRLSEQLNKTIPLASIDYRLSPEIKYPEHLNDVKSAIDKIAQSGYKEISLVGHSVGAYLILQYITKIIDEKLPITIKSIYLVDGIYDNETLIDEYPGYQSFVDESHEDYKEVKPINFHSEYWSNGLKVHIIMSYQDELLSLNQTRWLVEKLQDNKIEYQLSIGNYGKHEEVYKSEKLASYINSTYY